MEEGSLNFLNNVKSSTKQTDKLLEQQILENENSFEAFDSNTHINNNPNPNNINGINFEEKKTINNDNNAMGESHKKNENEMNGQDIEINPPPNKSEKIRKIKSIDLKENNDGNDQMSKDMNGNSIGAKKLENNNNDKKIKNKRKKQTKLVNSNSMDYIGIEKENDKNNCDTTYDMNLGNGKKNKKYNDINRSIDNTEVNDRVNIYQRMFDLKMSYLFKQDKKSNLFKPKNKANKPHTKLIKNKNNQNSELIIKDKNEKNTITNNKNKKNDKNDKIDIKNKNSYKKNNKLNNINKSNDNESDKNNKENDIISSKSKKSRMQRKNSLNSSSSNTSTKFSQTYERFLEIQEKKKEKIKQLKKLNEEKEKKQCYFSPKINKKSESIKDDFYKRQQNKIEEQKNKNEKPKFKYREEFDYNEYKKNKNKILIKKKNNENNQKQKGSGVSDRINKLYQWDKNRKQKIQERQKSVDELTKKEFSHKPKINKKSKKLAIINLEKYLYTSKGYNANNDNPKNTINECTFDRLYRDDVMKRKERQKILEKIYSPTFSPKITKYNKNVFNRNAEDENDVSNKDEDNYSIKEKKSLNVSKTYSVDKNNNNNNMDREYDTKSYNYTPKNNINDDDEMPSEYFIDDYAQQIRTRLFGKMSRSKNKSAINLKKINEMKIEENNDSDDDDDNENDYKKNKKNSIESESNDKKLSRGKNSKSYNVYKIKVLVKKPRNFETKDRKNDISNNNNNKKGRNRSVGFKI